MDMQALIKDVKADAIERGCDVDHRVVGESHLITLRGDDATYDYTVTDLELFQQMFDVRVHDDGMDRIDAFWNVLNEEFSAEN